MSTARRLFVVAAILAAFFVGRTTGICHAVIDAEVRVEDACVTLELDGEVYEYVKE